MKYIRKISETHTLTEGAGIPARSVGDFTMVQGEIVTGTSLTQMGQAAAASAPAPQQANIIVPPPGMTRDEFISRNGTDEAKERREETPADRIMDAIRSASR